MLGDNCKIEIINVWQHSMLDRGSQPFWVHVGSCKKIFFSKEITMFITKTSIILIDSFIPKNLNK